MKIIGTLYQAKSGAIILLCGNCHTELARQQIDDLHIDVYSLDDFISKSIIGTDVERNSLTKERFHPGSGLTQYHNYDIILI